MRGDWIRGTTTATTLAALLQAAPAANAQSTDPNAADDAAPAAEAALIDPFADQIIADMAEYLASAQNFRLKAEITTDQLQASGHMLQLARTAEVWIRRPDRFRAEVMGDEGHRRLYYDGKTLSMHQLIRNVFSIIDVPSSFDDMVDDVKERLGMPVPLADLLVSDAYENYQNNVTGGVYAGLHYLEGARHHHVLVSNGTIDYQIWIEDSPTPLPRKIVVTYVREPGAPQYTARITKWEFGLRLPDQVFAFRPPADADEIEVMLTSSASQ